MSPAPEPRAPGPLRRGGHLVLSQALSVAARALGVGPMAKLVVLGSVVGVLGGLGAVVFTLYTESLEQLFVRGEGKTYELLAELPTWWRVAIPALGGLVVGPIVYRWAREAKGHGVPEVMLAVAQQDGVIRPRVPIAKFFASGITIGTGGSVGREGPIIQIGAAIGSMCGQWLKLGPEHMRVLVGCGAAAGIAATFNAPISGAFFALEVILGNFALPAFSPIVLSSVLATVVARSALGDHPAFPIPSYELASAFEIPIHVGVGLLAGLAGVLFIRTLYAAEDAVDRVPLPGWIKPAVGGLALGVLYLYFPRMYGTGYATMEESLTHMVPFGVLVVAFFAKLLATSLTLGSGGSGGIFAPSLFLGAVLGSAVGGAVQGLGPEVVAPPGAYALVGMASMVAATTHAPITASLMLFEMSDGYELILPLMVGCAIATLAARRLNPESIYSLKLTRKGVRLRAPDEEVTLRKHKVRDHMRPVERTFLPDTPLEDLMEAFLSEGQALYDIVDGEARFVGTVTVHDVMGAIGSEDLAGLVLAHDVLRAREPTVGPDDDLAECFSRFALTERHRLPVVEGAEQRLVGHIVERDVAALYHREVLRKGASGVNFVPARDPTGTPDVVEIAGDHRLEYVPVPDEMHGKTLSELALRARFGVTVLAIRRRFQGSTPIEDVPTADDCVFRGDVLVVLGRKRDLEAFHRRVYRAEAEALEAH